MNDAFGNRMKKYENVSRLYLLPKTPVIIRIDGKSFHTFTRGFAKPFDPVLSGTMQDTMKYLCENIPGCVLGYTQSDEISLVLVDYANINACAWFDYNIQKCASIAASMATMAFNRFFPENIMRYLDDIIDNHYVYLEVCGNAMFDARVFNIPKEEVTNCILWRQNDATRNSIQMVGRAYFSHKELDGLNSDKIQEKLFSEKNINWNDYPAKFKRGSCCVKTQEEGQLRPKWKIDDDIPIFKGEGRYYIDKLILV